MSHSASPPPVSTSRTFRDRPLIAPRLRGEQDILGRPFDPAATAGLQAGAGAWTGAGWSTASWS